VSGEFLRQNSTRHIYNDQSHGTDEHWFVLSISGVDFQGEIQRYLEVGTTQSIILCTQYNLQLIVNSLSCYPHIMVSLKVARTRDSRETSRPSGNIELVTIGQVQNKGPD